MDRIFANFYQIPKLRHLLLAKLLRMRNSIFKSAQNMKHPIIMLIQFAS